jgi:predicted metal-dependent phosphotriesterase family hydrolase
MRNPFPTDCLALTAKALREQGMTERELDLMFKENPARLLGLSPWNSSE